MNQSKQVVVYRLHHPKLDGFSFIGSTSSSENPKLIKTNITSQHRHSIKKNEPRKEWFKLYENGLDAKELVLEILEKCSKAELYDVKQKYYNVYYPQQSIEEQIAEGEAPPYQPELSIVEQHDPQHSYEILCMCEDYKKQIQELKQKNEELVKDNEELKTKVKKLTLRNGKISRVNDSLYDTFARMKRVVEAEFKHIDNGIQYAIEDNKYYGIDENNDTVC